MMLMQTQGLTKSFSGLRAIDNVDFSVPEGQVRALIGPNGAGKTTLVGLLTGRIPSTQGRVVFDGRDIGHMPAHRRIGLGMAYTFQITSIFPNLSVWENVALAARPVAANVADAVSDALSKVGLSARADSDASALSYGHQRLLEIAMGIAQAPRLLILDEPTQGLAEGEIATFQTLINELRQKTTVLLIEHNMDVVMQISDFVTVLNNGRILFEGTPQEVQANAAVQAAYLGTEHVDA